MKQMVEPAREDKEEPKDGRLKAGAGQWVLTGQDRRGRLRSWAIDSDIAERALTEQQSRSHTLN